MHNSNQQKNGGNYMLRSLISILFAVLYLILTLPVLGIITLIHRKDPEKAGRISQVMIRWAFRVLCVLAGIRITAIGQENIPDDRGAVFIGNHLKPVLIAVWNNGRIHRQGFYRENTDFQHLDALHLLLLPESE